MTVSISDFPRPPIGGVTPNLNWTPQTKNLIHPHWSLLECFARQVYRFRNGVFPIMPLSSPIPKTCLLMLHLGTGSENFKMLAAKPDILESQLLYKIAKKFLRLCACFSLVILSCKNPGAAKVNSVEWINWMRITFKSVGDDDFAFQRETAHFGSLGIRNPST
jgi:hypothetical protein